MIFVFGGLLILSFIKEREVLFSKKRNLLLFMILSACGIALGVVRMMFPYIPSISFALEKYLK